MPIEVRPAANATEWEVARQGEERPISTHRTLFEAEMTGRQIARSEGSEFVLKGRNGRSSYGIDARGRR
jgi:hypothetical protein